jgi:hypothetical protein
MSRGPGRIEARITELFAAQGSDNRSFSVSDLADVAFELGGVPATRAQRLSATRAAHRFLRRIEDLYRQMRKLDAEADAQAIAAGAKHPGKYGSYAAWGAFIDAKAATPAGERRQRLEKSSLWNLHHHNWRVTEMPDRRVLFHHCWFPVRIWAVSIQPAGVVWNEVDAITRITDDWVSVRYQGEHARFRRWRLQDGAWWRGVRFCSERDGRAACRFDEWWQERFGYRPGSGAPPHMAMPLAEAMRLLGVPDNFTREDILAAFRREVKKAHPDAGGTAEQFRELVMARDRLLASIGTSAPTPKMPTFYPKGVQVVYRTVRRSGPHRLRLGHTRRVARG